MSEPNDPKAQPRWLDDIEQQAWRALASVIIRLPSALDAQLQRDAKLTHFEYFTMALLSEAPDRRLKLSELARGASATLSRLSHVVTRLEKSGWVRREAVPGRRGAFAVLTEAGFDKVVASASGHVEIVRDLVFNGLDAAGVERLRRAAQALVDNLDGGTCADPEDPR